ncbi:MAG: hypoxanthine phosphoribosyltransferase [Alloprevotella sp.]
MKKIQVRDREFTVSIPEAVILQRVAQVAEQINSDLKGENPLFLAVLNGSFMFAADLLRGINIPCEISFVRMASYEGTSSTGKVKELLGLKEDISGRTIVVVEDIIDSGLTMEHLLQTLQQKGPKQVKVASLLVKPGNLKVDLDIPYCCFEIPNDFIVGYGLDYDGYGRNLRDIYTVVAD